MSEVTAADDRQRAANNTAKKGEGIAADTKKQGSELVEGLGANATPATPAGSR